MSDTPKKRGRPATFDRSAALDTAIPLFWRHGYEGTSLAMLTNEIGCTPPTLYAAFGSKEGLYREVVTRYRDREVTSHGARGGEVSAYRTVEEFLRAVARAFTDPDQPRGCMVGTGALHCAPGNEAIANFAAVARTQGYQRFVATVQEARRRGELPDDTDAEAIARFYVAVVQGMSVQAIDGADREQLDALADIALTAWPGHRR